MLVHCHPEKCNSKISAVDRKKDRCLVCPLNEGAFVKSDEKEHFPGAGGKRRIMYIPGLFSNLVYKSGGTAAR